MSFDMRHEETTDADIEFKQKIKTLNDIHLEHLDFKSLLKEKQFILMNKYTMSKILNGDVKRGDYIMTKNINGIIFISHRWDDRKCPDVNNNKIREIYNKPGDPEKLYFMDCYCLPQFEREPYAQAYFKMMLQQMNKVLINGEIKILLNETSKNRGWCQFEYQLSSLEIKGNLGVYKKPSIIMPDLFHELDDCVCTNGSDVKYLKDNKSKWLLSSESWKLDVLFLLNILYWPIWLAVMMLLNIIKLVLGLGCCFCVLLSSVGCNPDGGFLFDKFFKYNPPVFLHKYYFNKRFDLIDN